MNIQEDVDISPEILGTKKIVCENTKKVIRTKKNKSGVKENVDPN